MERFLDLGRSIFSLALGAFGIQYLMFAHTPNSLINIPPYTVQNFSTACLAGIGFLVAALSFVSRRKGRLCALLLGAALLLNFLIFHAARILSNMQSGNIRTRGFETLAMAGTAFVLAATFPAQRFASRAGAFVGILAQVGRFLVVVALAILGMQHVMYHDFIASLIPAWMPARLFLAYFTGCGFLAAALSIGIGKVTRLASALLATMFLIWVFTLHGPRVAHALHSGNEWSSMLVALCMSGMALIMGRPFVQKHWIAMRSDRNIEWNRRPEKRASVVG